MTISTMEQLEAVPVGASVSIGTTAANRRGNVWQRVEGGLSRNGLTLSLAAFSTEVNNNSVRGPGTEVEPGQVYLSGRRLHLVLDRAYEDEGTGWWAITFAPSGAYYDIRLYEEIPGVVTTNPEWWTAAWPLGSAMLVFLRNTTRLEREVAASNERYLAARRSTLETQAATTEAVEQAVEQVKNDLSAALLAYCEENHIKPDDPLVQVMRDNGLPTPAVTVPVTVTVNGTIRALVGQQELTGKLPPGSRAWEEYLASNQYVHVYFTKDVVVDVETMNPGCVCSVVGDRQITDALGGEGIQTYSYEVANRACPRN